MSSTLACIGMDVSTPQAMSSLLAQITRIGGTPIASSGGVQTYRWQDPSGARLVYDMIGSQPLLMPSFSPTSTTPTSYPYVSAESSTPDVTRMAIVGEDGETEIGITVELEQRRHLASYSQSGQVALVAFGVDVEVFFDEDAYARSPRSLMGSLEELGPPPEEVVAAGEEWPPRMSSTAFFSPSFYDPAATATPLSRMAAVMLDARRESNRHTGSPFWALRVLTAFGEVSMVMAAPDRTSPPPDPAQIVAGNAYLIGSLLGEPLPAPAAPTARQRSAPLPRTGESRRAWRQRAGGPASASGDGRAGGPA